MSLFQMRHLFISSTAFWKFLFERVEQMFLLFLFYSFWKYLRNDWICSCLCFLPRWKISTGVHTWKHEMGSVSKIVYDGCSFCWLTDGKVWKRNDANYIKTLYNGYFLNLDCLCSVYVLINWLFRVLTGRGLKQI